MASRTCQGTGRWVRGTPWPDEAPGNRGERAHRVRFRLGDVAYVFPIMSGRRKAGRKEGEAGRRAWPGSSGKRRGSRSPEPQLAAADLVPALVDAKLHVLKLVRALDAAGVDPRDHPELPEALAT